MKTQEQKKLDAKNYLAKTAQHLFVVNDKLITTLVPFEKDGQQYYAKLVIGPDYASIDMVNSNWYKWDLKTYLFPQYVKTNSIPYFKKMREIVKLVQTEISLTDNKVLIEKLKLKSKDLTMVKS